MASTIEQTAGYWSFTDLVCRALKQGRGPVRVLVSLLEPKNLAALLLVLFTLPWKVCYSVVGRDINQGQSSHRFEIGYRIMYPRKAGDYGAISPDLSPMWDLALSKPAFLLQLWNDDDRYTWRAAEQSC